MTIVIAVDGDAASGKGMLAMSLARELHFDYLDTGALYRRLAYHIMENHIDTDNVEGILSIMQNINFTEILDGSVLHDDNVGKIASKIAPHKEVRNFLNEIQKRFPDGKNGAVLDGRDIGTIVLPTADVKFFITADIEVRAERRFKQLQMMGKDIIFEQVLKDLAERDQRDRHRNISPALPGRDAFVLDTSVLNAEQVLECALRHVRMTLKEKLKN